MEKDNDTILQQFFSEARNLEIPNGDFSRKVTERLVDRHEHRITVVSRVWTAACCLAGFAMLYYSGALHNVPIYVKQILINLVMFVQHGLLNFSLEQIPQYVYALPLCMAIAVAVKEIRKELNQLF